MPENFEFPACVACNSGSRRQDEMFGFYSQLLDFDKSKMIRAEDRERLLKLRQSIAHHSPDALPDVATSHAVNRVGSIITPKPVAFSVRTPPHLKDAVAMTGAKLTHALYLRETGKLLSKNHQFLSAHISNPDHWYGNPDLVFCIPSAEFRCGDAHQHQNIRGPLPIPIRLQSAGGFFPVRRSVRSRHYFVGNCLWTRS